MEVKEWIFLLALTLYLAPLKADLTCKDDEFDCFNESICLDADQFCDGNLDCKDGSDERHSLTQLLNGEIFCDRSDNAQNQCLLPKKYICDGRSHCFEGTDECLCDKDKSTSEQIYLDDKCFHCLNHPTVIPIGKLCDGIIHCPDLSDECLCIKNKVGIPEICKSVHWEHGNEPAQRFTCKAVNSSFKITPLNVTHLNVTHLDVCDGWVDCDGSIDEKNCPDCQVHPTNLSSNEKCGYKCRRQNKWSTRCDGEIKCDNVKEEECDGCPEPPQFCNHLDLVLGLWKYTCASGLTLSPGLICDGIDNCPGGEEEFNCTNRFDCVGKSPLYIHTKRVCDGQKDCVDSSDELDCSNKTHFYCNDTGGVKFIKINQVCDGNEDCENGEDECRPECITGVHGFFVAVAFILGILAVTGNLIVIILFVWDIWVTKERPTGKDGMQKILILSRSISELLVGIYSTAICIQLSKMSENYCREDRAWRSGSTCSALGAILLIGSESSVFALTIFIILRTYPFLWFNLHFYHIHLFPLKFISLTVSTHTMSSNQ